ncbi:hypothetical protein NDU88_000277 [Pleurodeles waltl]|uniref:Uncharacterized protein n=1 Tax=Pleurodeles waltl TaxID=8319 RepID=A0AAV7TFT9_PLEWA|nr:hypothetical protein NDU88_000277 [Pleurodeles waltl]
MNDVHHIAGPLEGRMNLAARQEKEPAFKSDGEDWVKLKRGLLAKFSATPRQGQASATKKGQARQPSFNKGQCTQKTQIVQQSRKLAKVTLQDKHGEKRCLWGMKKVLQRLLDRKENLSTKGMVGTTLDKQEAKQKALLEPCE